MDDIQINQVVTIKTKDEFAGMVGRVVSIYYQNNEYMCVIELNERGHECVHSPLSQLEKGAYTVTFE